MIVVSVTYQAIEDSKFDFDYYTTKHLPLVRSLWGNCGLLKAEGVRGIAMPAGGPIIFVATALLTFESADHFQRAAQKHGKEIMADIKNFTPIAPVVQINEPLG